MKVFLRRENIFLLVLFLFALGLRLVYLGQLRNSPLFDTPIMDARYHDQWALAIRDGLPFHEGPYFRAPLYTYFLAGIYALFGHNYVAPRIVQFLIGSLNCLLIYWLGKRTFDPAVGRVAAVLAAVYGAFIYFEGELLIPVLILFLDLWLILAVLVARERTGWWRWLGCGAILGLSAIARPNVLLFGVVLLPWLVVWLRRRGLSLGRSMRHVVGFVLGTALIILPVTVRNYIVSKDFVPIASQGGVNFFIGNNNDSDGFTAVIPGTSPTWWGGYRDAIQLAEQAEGYPLRASQVSDYWFRRGLEFLREEPGIALRLIVKKLALFWSGPEVSNNQDIYFFSKCSPLLRVLLWPGPICCPFGIIAPLALAGMVLAWRKRQGSGGLMALFVFSYMVSVVLFFVNARYRLPVIPFLLPFAGYSLVCLFRTKRLTFIILLMGMILVFGLAVNLNLGGYNYSESSSRAISHTDLGSVYLRKKLYDQAKAEFQQALVIEPRYIYAFVGLAEAHFQADSVNKAIDLLEKVISARPGMSEVHYRLGNYYSAKGRLGDAIAQWKETIQWDPEFPGSYLQLSQVYQNGGHYEEAVAFLQQAIQVDPQNADAHHRLGILCRRLGRNDGAVEHYKRAIEVEPNFADAYNNLAWLYSQEGINLDEGIELVEKALELDPESAAYWDTLAELYIKKGELSKAAEIFRRMIQKEPDESFWRERFEQVGG